MIADMINNKKLNSIVIELFIIVIELFIRGRKLNISIFLLHNPVSCITQSTKYEYFTGEEILPSN